MGQCYSVCANFKFKNDDSSSFCNAVKRIVNEMDGQYCNFESHDDHIFETPFGCFQLIATTRGSYISEFGLYESEFDASYSWEWVMQNIFEEVMPVLDDGSWVEIRPDSGWELWVVNNGEVKYSYEN